MIIALTGYTGAGKSYIAECLSEEGDYWHRSFSSPLKQENLRRPNEARNDYKRRLQRAASIINLRDPLYYINALLNSLEDRTVIDDLRTPLQLSHLQAYCLQSHYPLVLIRVLREGTEPLTWMDSFAIPTHGTIVNNNLTYFEIVDEVARIFHTNSY